MSESARDNFGTFINQLQKKKKKKNSIKTYGSLPENRRGTQQ